MPPLGRSTAPATSNAGSSALIWIRALSVLGTLAAVIVLALTGNADYLGPVIAIGTAAAALGGSVHVRIRIRR